MKRKYDHIRVEEKDEAVTLKLPGGSSVEVPQATIRRSAVLQEAIQTSDAPTKVCIPLPQGVLQDWLQSVDALKAAATSTGHGTDIALHPRLLHFVRASDFMNDEEGVQGLCRQAARWLFGPQGILLTRPDQASDQAVSEENAAPSEAQVQVLRALPQQLVIRILRGSSLPVTKQLRILPSCFHTAAIHATYPRIEAERSVSINASNLEYAPFAEALWPELSRITSFRAGTALRRVVISPQVAEALGSQLAKLSCIQQLGLSRCAFGGHAAATLGPHLAQLTCIQKLDLSSIGKVGALSLGPHLVRLTSIQQLDLAENGLGHDGVKSLGPHLAHLTLIHRFFVGCNGIGAKGVKSLLPHLAHLTSIQHLDLSCNNIGDPGAKSLGPHLADLMSITHLDLRDNSFSADGAKALGPHLACLASIKYLDLSCNEILDYGVISLGPHLAQLTSMQHLHLRKIEIGSAYHVVLSTDSEDDIDDYVIPPGVKSLAPHLGQLKSILQLDLSWNKISADDAGWLGPHLAHLTCIQRLCLGRNDICDEGLKSLGPHLSRLASITHLDLSRNRIGADAVISLGPQLARIACL